MRYLVSYDLYRSEKSYAGLFSALKQMRGKRILDTQWEVRQDETTAEKLRDHFWKWLDPNDRLLVFGVDTGDWSGFNLMTKMSEL